MAFGKAAAVVAVLITAAAPAAGAEPAHGEQAFTVSGTFTAPEGITSVFVAVWGAGGGGGEANPGGGGGAAWCSVAVTPAAEYTVTVGVGGPAGEPGSDSSVGVAGSPALVVAHGGAAGTAEAPGRGGAADCGTSPGLAAPGSDGTADRPGEAGVIPSAPPGGIGAGGAAGMPGAPGYAYFWW
ncbi:glycine-rich domain-containing protein [Amycolatopsis tucumanensis]|uniref:glycine-rich domain-containing protein n=1 Tax=Amycolatopsis tucumanensis TaxID=401106 RepID=UPI003D74C924